jgi:hypothetical protein
LACQTGWSYTRAKFQRVSGCSSRLHTYYSLWGAYHELNSQFNIMETIYMHSVGTEAKGHGPSLNPAIVDYTYNVYTVGTLSILWGPYRRLNSQFNIMGTIYAQCGDRGQGLWTFIESNSSGLYIYTLLVVPAGPPTPAAHREPAQVSCGRWAVEVEPPTLRRHPGCERRWDPKDIRGAL